MLFKGSCHRLETNTNYPTDEYFCVNWTICMCDGRCRKGNLQPPGLPSQWLSAEPDRCTGNQRKPFFSVFVRLSKRLVHKCSARRKTSEKKAKYITSICETSTESAGCCQRYNSLSHSDSPSVNIQICVCVLAST